jgi:hypothetical protein
MIWRGLPIRHPQARKASVYCLPVFAGEMRYISHTRRVESTRSCFSRCSHMERARQFTPIIIPHFSEFLRHYQSRFRQTLHKVALKKSQSSPLHVALIISFAVQHALSLQKSANSVDVIAPYVLSQLYSKRAYLSRHLYQFSKKQSNPRGEKKSSAFPLFKEAAVCYNARVQGPIAQRLEQGAHNSLVAGSIPAGPIYNQEARYSIDKLYPASWF